MNHILEQMAENIRNREDTFEWMERASGVSRAVLCRLSQGKTKYLSVEIAIKILKMDGLELKISGKRR